MNHRLIKIRATEIQQRLTELMLEAGGMNAMPYLPLSWSGNWVGPRVSPEITSPLTSRYLNYRKVSIYGGTNEIQKNIIAKQVLNNIKNEFFFNPRTRTFKRWLRKFLAKNYTIDFKKSLLESKSVSSPQIWDSFREMGLFDLFIPEEYSGFKGGPVELMIIMETFGKFLVSEPFLNSVLSSKIISQGALKWQKDILFSMISKGESIISPSIQEPSFNYLPLNVNLVGNFDGDFLDTKWEKNHIINGSISEKFLTIVKTGNTNSLEKDLTFFIIESDLENLDGKEYPFVDGTRALELEFKDLKITGDAVLGEVGSGYSILQNVLDYGVIASLAESIGVLSQIFNLTSTYIRERKQFGLSISQFQVIQHKLVDMYIKVEEAKSMMMMAVSAFDSDEYKVRQKNFPQLSPLLIMRLSLLLKTPFNFMVEWVWLKKWI